MVNSEHPFSWKALSRILILFITLLLAWEARYVLVIILIALMFASAIYPIVQKLDKKMPRILAIIIVFLMFVAPLALIIIFIIPSLIKQFPQMVTTFTSVISAYSWVPASIRNFNLNNLVNNDSSFFYSAQTAISLFYTVLSTVFLTLYFIYDHERLFELFLDLFPDKQDSKIKKVLDKLAEVNGQYIRGNLIISLITGTVVFLGLLVMKIPFALPLAIFTAIIDLLPLVGPTLGAVPAIIVGFTISPTLGFTVALFYLIYQQFENVFISPAIYNKSLNLSPSLSFLAVLVGGGLFGIVGAFLALPIAASIPPVVKFARTFTKEQS